MSEITDEQIRDLLELAKSDVSIPEIAEAVGMSNYTASAVVRAIKHMKPLPGQGVIYGRTKGVNGKMKRGE